MIGVDVAKRCTLDHLLRISGTYVDKGCLAVAAVRGRKNMRRYGQKISALLLRQSQISVSLATGAVVAFTVLGAGLGLIKFHGGRWPWWFHGAVIALITGLITALLTKLNLREHSRREARRLAGECMSHEVCTALQILVQRTYLEPDQRAQLEDEAIERLRVAVREIMPGILDIPTTARPAASVSPGQDNGKSKSEKAGGAAA